MTSSSHTGRLLVATPVIGDPNFERTVVLLLDHDSDGAFGLVLNRPSTLAASEILPGWSDLTASPPVVFSGGPVEQQGIIGLARRSRASSGGPFQVAVGPVEVVDLSAEPIAAIGAVDGVRLFAGYAAWSQGQLEHEIAEGAWWVVDAQESDAITQSPDYLWTAVLRRQPEPLRRWSFLPLDPSWN